MSKHANGATAAPSRVPVEPQKVIQYINFKLAALGAPVMGAQDTNGFVDLARPLLENHQQKNRLLENYFCPTDARIQKYLDETLSKSFPKGAPKLPTTTFILDRPGLARALSLPVHKDKFESDIVHSYRVKQGVLHNPKHDRRTTKGVFHVAEGGLDIPNDKKSVPLKTFGLLMEKAVKPPKSLMRLPFTSDQKNEAELWVSLFMRPLVCPEIPGKSAEKTMEIRFFVPGNLVSNLDFVENIFGNAGDPYLPENDPGLDVDHWTGHTGCVILAPHLTRIRKKDVGLPPYSKATEKQKRDGMCWKKASELYNDGGAFKITCRDERGVMVTIIADNYFGYSKKEVKTQISYSANLFGLSEEEHAGGAVAFPSYDLGEEFFLYDSLPQNNKKFSDVKKVFKKIMSLHPKGYGVDKKYEDIIYVPEDATFNLNDKVVSWKKGGKVQKIPLLAHHSYLLPSGYKIHMEKQMGGPDWRLVGTRGDGTLCHKPCTVSGGGKSEISKSIRDAMVQGPIFTSEFNKDMDLVEKILDRNYGDRFKRKKPKKRPSRPILSPKRSLGSVIKLFTPSTEYSAKYNRWLRSLPHHIREMVFIVKRHYKTSWGKNWRQHFSVDRVNGTLGHELKYGHHKLVAHYLRLGHDLDGSRRIYKLRQDFHPAAKVQMEDDITASVVVPRKWISHLNPAYKNHSLKLVKNCESKLFQRPDDAIFRGYDKQAEKDLTSEGVFLSNYQPLGFAEARELKRDAIGFEKYTQPVQDLVNAYLSSTTPEYISVPSNPRIVDGKPTKNPRYLQNRPDLMAPRDTYLAHIGARLFRWIAPEEPILFPVHAVLPGRRNNAADKKNNIPPLAVYNPIHYQELPELFIDFICSVTGKSPSTTGFGSEGALTKGPFNALPPIVDLNNALVSWVLSEYDGFTSAAGTIGPKYRVDHDISLLIPEIWCRMSVEERSPKFLIDNGYLEKLKDFSHKGKKVPASLLGYRITIKFVHAFLGRIFNNPDVVFNDEMLRPETQSMDDFSEALFHLGETQKRVAENYFKDGSVEWACPPLKALLHIMVYGQYKGKNLNHKSIRDLFTRENMVKSDWYKKRLKAQQERDIALWSRHITYLSQTLEKNGLMEPAHQIRLEAKLTKAKAELNRVRSEKYLSHIFGTIGADPYGTPAKGKFTAGLRKLIAL